MSLQKPWRDLDRGTVARAPERYGVYEVGDAHGEILDVGSGVLRSELKSVLAYTDGEQVRWEETGSAERAEELAAEHRRRAGLDG